MKINGNQIITGMYIYDPGCEYTINDFVVKDGVIYICIKDNKGEDPETSESYTIYLGDRGRSIDLQEYLNFLETSEGENKYLSVGMLQAVMSYYLLGPTGKGIIGDYVCFDSEGLRVSLKSGEEGKFTDPETIITEILFSEDINHALLRVSRFLPEINGYVGGSLGVSEYSGEDQKSVILRQYTYLQEGSEDKIRLQELIDPIDGVIWYRSGNMTTQSSGTWKCSIVNSRSLKSKVEDLIDIYTARLKVIRSLESHLKSNFRYRKLELSGGKPTSFSIPGGLGEIEITLTISELVSDGFVKTYETSINLGDKLEDDVFPSYLVGERCRIDLREELEGYSISLSDKVSGAIPVNSWFSGAYYKEYYGLS